MEIPANSRLSRVKHLNEELIANLRGQKSYTYAYVLRNGYGKDEVFEVLEEWKKKGWYCFYLERFDGVIIDIQIYNYDYMPSNRGLNKLIKY